MAREGVIRLAKGIQRLDIQPGILLQLVAELEAAHAAPDDEHQVIEPLWERVGAIRVVMTDGSATTLRVLTEQLVDAFADITFDAIDPENYYRTSPFDELGRIRVSEQGDALSLSGAPTLADLCPVTYQRTSSRTALPQGGATPEHRTIWAYVDCFWFTPFIIPFIHYWAYTEVKADGEDSIDHQPGPLGVIYIQARYLCSYYNQRLQEPMPPELKADPALWRLLREDWARQRDRWCEVVRGAPLAPRPCFEITTRVCAAHKPRTANSHCSTETGHWVSRVSATSTVWGGFPLAVRSFHRVVVHEGDAPWTAMVSTYDGTVTPYPW